jgi:hypothetical protein
MVTLTTDEDNIRNINMYDKGIGPFLEPCYILSFVKKFTECTWTVTALKLSQGGHGFRTMCNLEESS